MRIKIKEIEKLCLEILRKKGLGAKDARVILNEYLDSELRGISCHGFQSFVNFGTKLVENAGPPKIKKQGANFLYIDGNKNLGQIVCNKYVPKLIEKAKKRAIAMMGIFNMHSYLRPGTYARIAAENNLVGFVFNYGGWKRIAPYGSIDPFFGTNPIAIGVPGQKFPVVVDFATSKIALMKIRLAAKLNKKIVKDLAIDKNGNPTTDPNEAMAGALLPFGSYKGSGLALVLDLLTKTMFGIDIKEKVKANRGFLFIFLNPKMFTNVKRFKKDVTKTTEKMKKLRKAKGFNEIQIPGEREQKLYEENLKRGYIDLDKKIFKEIKNLL